MPRPPRLAASEFQTLLDELLAGASRQALEQWIRSRGEGLPSSERQSFLDDLANRFKQRHKVVPAPRDLLADIGAFIEDLAAGSFYPAPAERGSTPWWRFLLGSWDTILEQARRPADPWATEGRHWAFLVLAMAALEGRKPSASTQLWQAWLKLARLHPQYYRKEASPIAETAPRLSLVDLLRWKIQREPQDVAAWARTRRQLGAIALGWATEVLKASQRGSYPEAALSRSSPSMGVGKRYEPQQEPLLSKFRMLRNPRNLCV